MTSTRGAITEQLESLAKGFAPPYPCTAIFVNECPPDWDVHIIAMGADFFYDDGTSAQVGPVAVRIDGPNGSASLSSPNPMKCTIRVLGAISVKADGEAPQTFSKQNTAAPGNCMLQTNFILAPKAVQPKTEHAKGTTFYDLLSFETRATS